MSSIFNELFILACSKKAVKNIMKAVKIFFKYFFTFHLSCLTELNVNVQPTNSNIFQSDLLKLS